MVRLPPCAGGDPLAAGIGATARTGPLLDQALSRPGRGAGRVRLRPRPDLPGARGGHAGVARLPARGLADVLRRVPRRLRVPGRLARAPEGVRGVRPGAEPDRRRAAGPDRVATRRRTDRDRAPRGRRRTAARGHRAVDHVPDDGRRHRHHHVAHRRCAVAPRAAPRRSATTDRRARPVAHGHRGVPPLLSAGACPQADRGRRHRVRWGPDEAGGGRAAERSGRRTRRRRSSRTPASS